MHGLQLSMPSSDLVLHVIPGASENRLLQNILSGSKNNLGIISLTGPDSFIEDWANVCQIPYWNLNLKIDTRNPLRLILNAIKLHSVLRKIQPVSVFFHSFGPSLLSALIYPIRSKCLYIPVRHHNKVHHLEDKKLFIGLDKFIGFFSDAIVAVSNSVKETILLEGTPESKVHVIFNAMDFKAHERSKTLDLKEPRLLAIGRIDWQKNYPSIIEMLQQVKETYPQVKLDVLGAGGVDLRNELQAQIIRLHLQDNMVFHGWKENVSDYFANADIFIHAALDEACPLVLLEALGAGIPIVSTGNGGCKDVLDGFYESVDTSKSRLFADAVLNAIDESVQLDARATEIRILAMQKFNVAKMSKEYIDLIIKVRGNN